MSQRSDQLKAQLVDRIAAMAEERIGGAKAALAARFIRLYYAHVPPADMLNESLDNLYGEAMALWTFARTREPGRPKIRVYDPRTEDHGWRSIHTVIEIVNDDMPFLVDSVTAALHGKGLNVHLVIHPVINLRRDAAGKIVELLDPVTAPPDLAGESFMHVEVDQQPAGEILDRIARDILAVLGDVRAAVTDWTAMRNRIQSLVREITESPPPLPREEVSEALAFLEWVHDDHMTLLGYRDYRLDGKDEGFNAIVVEESGLGVLRDPARIVIEELRTLDAMPPEVRAFVNQPRLLMIAKTNQLSTVHRAAPMDYIGVKRLDEAGRVIGLRIILGLFTSAAYNLSPRQIPVLRHKVEQCLWRSGFLASSHDGKALVNILETYPRDELFQISDDELYDIATGILNLQERQRTALFVRRDPFERFVSCLIFIPRDRYNTDLQHRIAAILQEAYGGTETIHNASVSDLPLARLHIIVRTTAGTIPPVRAEELEARIALVTRSWSDHLHAALVAAKGEEHGLVLLRRYGEAFPAGYRERFSIDTAIFDIDMIEAVRPAGGAADSPAGGAADSLAGGAADSRLHGGLALNLYRPFEAADTEIRLKIYHPAAPVPLYAILPMLENMGLKVVEEIPYRIESEPGHSVLIHDFALDAGAYAEIDIATVREIFQDAFLRIWTRQAENDGFNQLVLATGLNWREVSVVRAYARYLRQTGVTFSQAYMEETLARHPAIVGRLVALFLASFDPAGRESVEARKEEIRAAIAHGLDEVSNPDEDRILRLFLNLIESTLRTNYFQKDPSGAPKSYLSLKLDSHRIEELPDPRPMVEIFVYSPRMEGIHLRGGKVARGGIRWSDRREDFRREILGLMKAQMVKNAVIVPVGAKGGFVLKAPPPPDAGREALAEEGVACYKILIRGLLDLTDNLSGDTVVPPPEVVRLDDDDPYLVVAADKGTATFSDIANGLAEAYGFWLGDAFASGGSQGYDHKKMGITARGAWVSVMRHFREMGIDTQTQDFTVVGVGDMAGDVFGNGMLQSDHIKLVAAFNHQHIFLDPDPDPKASFAERRRLFNLPRSSWADYDLTLVSPGGGVFPRQAKTIPVSKEVQALLRLESAQLRPAELIRALLKAPVDLLFFGGIGTFVKAAAESDAEAGDRVNDALRVDGRELRCRVIGEGANLAVTQRGRIEFALAGGRLNTDAVDNSAGVDCSDHEVNIKILLGGVVAAGDLTLKQRNQLLEQMTDEVADLVLRDNQLQTQALSMIARQGVSRADAQERMMRVLEKAGRLDRALEFLPDEETLAERLAAGKGLTRPEAAVLFAYGKIWLYDLLLASDLPDDPLLAEDLLRYFPVPLVERFRDWALRHRLRREIIATHATNSMVNRVGGAFVPTLMERTGMSPVDIARAYLVARDSFGLRSLWTQIEALSGAVPATQQLDLLLQTAGLVERVSLWLLRTLPHPIEIGVQIGRLGPVVAAFDAILEPSLPPERRTLVKRRAKDLVGKNVPPELARRIAQLDSLAAACDLAMIMHLAEVSIERATKFYFAAGTRFDLDWLIAAAHGIEITSHWQKLAVAALVEDFENHQRQLAIQALATGVPTPEEALERWASGRTQAVDRCDQLLTELKASRGVDLAMLTVANRQLRTLLG